MVPSDDAIVPALGCLGCGRLIPLTAVRSVQVRSKSDERRLLNRALRGQRRVEMRKGNA